MQLRTSAAAAHTDADRCRCTKADFRFRGGQRAQRTTVTLWSNGGSGRRCDVVLDDKRAAAMSTQLAGQLEYVSTIDYACLQALLH